MQNSWASIEDLARFIILNYVKFSILIIVQMKVGYVRECLRDVFLNIPQTTYLHIYSLQVCASLLAAGRLVSVLRCITARCRWTCSAWLHPATPLQTSLPFISQLNLETWGSLMCFLEIQKGIFGNRQKKTIVWETVIFKDFLRRVYKSYNIHWSEVYGARDRMWSFINWSKSETCYWCSSLKF